ncbi:hypothetical protein [Curtobacterium sp. BRB10]|uniref:hypothetical protein n=1 Tax=Curtobacterium sp. BRB10 TaxID=2962579 RepID=UPI0028824593|nr:hypothetical protein [Curtobacterium sp. BRB10]MDT0235266.1 hypothetical protein [Curtobacterium sp. BRB10]
MASPLLTMCAAVTIATYSQGGNCLIDGREAGCVIAIYAVTNGRTSVDAVSFEAGRQGVALAWSSARTDVSRYPIGYRTIVPYSIPPWDQSNPYLVRSHGSSLSLPR